MDKPTEEVGEINYFPPFGGALPKRPHSPTIRADKHFSDEQCAINERIQILDRIAVRLFFLKKNENMVYQLYAQYRRML